ncbi:hypothetical protein KAU32_11395 [bacterium]|nr:hypothetical protein [bacterium]
MAKNGLIWGFSLSLFLFAVFYLIEPKLAFLLSAVILLITLSFIDLKYAFYLFLVVLPLSFNIPLNVGGLKDIFVTDGVFLVLFGVLIVKKIIANDLKLINTILTVTILSFVAISLLSILVAAIRMDSNELYRINSILHIRYARLNPLTVSPVSMSNFFVFFRTFFPLFLYYFVHETFSTDKREVKRVMKILLLSAMATAAFGWLSKYNLVPDSIYSLYHTTYHQASLFRIPSTFDNPQSFGTFLALSICIVYYYILEKPRNIALYFTGAFLFFIFLFTYSFGSYAALIGGLFLITLLSRRLSTGGRIAIIAVVCIAFVSIVLSNDFILEKIRVSTTIVNPRKQFPGTVQTRIIKWGRWMKILQPHLLTGLGYPTVWQDNNYIKMLVNAGILGFLSYYFMIGIMIFRGIKLYLQQKGDRLGIIFLVSAVIFLIHSISYDVSIVFKVNAYFFIFAAFVSKGLYEKKNI